MRPSSGEIALRTVENGGYLECDSITLVSPSGTHTDQTETSRMVRVWDLPELHRMFSDKPYLSRCERVEKENALINVVKLWAGEEEAKQRINAMSDRKLDKSLRRTQLTLTRIASQVRPDFLKRETASSVDKALGNGESA